MKIPKSLSVIGACIAVLYCLSLLYSIAKRARSKVLLVVLSAGGHTSEMLYLLTIPVIRQFSHVVVLQNDVKSKIQFAEFSERYKNMTGQQLKYTIYPIPIGVRVGQRIVKAVPRILLSCVYCLVLNFIHQPSLILTNGPGTCLPPLISGKILRFIGLSKSKLIFVESIGRFNSMSYSGRVAKLIVDKFVIHNKGCYEKATTYKAEEIKPTNQIKEKMIHIPDLMY